MRLRGAAGTAVAVLLAASPAVTAAPPPPRCVALAFSSDFARDRTVFCAAETADHDAVHLHRSSDAGRTWGPGRLVADGIGALHRTSAKVAISPLFARDHQVLVWTYAALYASFDGGQSFGLVDDSGGYTDVLPFVDGVPGRPETARTAYLITYGATVCCASVYDPLSRDPDTDTRRVLGTLEYTDYFLIPPDYRDTRKAVVLGANVEVYHYDRPVTEPGEGAYMCVADFSCQRRIHSFDNSNLRAFSRLGRVGDYYYGGYPDNDPGPDSDLGKLRFWRTRDGGLTWQRWSSVEHLHAKYVPTLWHYTMMASSPDVPHRLFQLVATQDDLTESTSATVPAFELFRSDDDGATWRRIGHSWGRRQPVKAPSILPWNASHPELHAALGGRLYVTAARRNAKGAVTFQGMYCSTNLGQTWRAGTC